MVPAVHTTIWRTTGATAVQAQARSDQERTKQPPSRQRCRTLDGSALPWGAVRIGDILSLLPPSPSGMHSQSGPAIPAIRLLLAHHCTLMPLITLSSFVCVGKNTKVGLHTKVGSQSQCCGNLCVYTSGSCQFLVRIQSHCGMPSASLQLPACMPWLRSRTLCSTAQW